MKKEKLRYLYLLVSSDGTIFKIGSSSNPLSRSADLPQSIDPERSFQFPVKEGDALRAEKSLQYLFRAYSNKEQSGDGKTEWFDIAALPLVLNFIDHNSARLGCGRKEYLMEARVGAIGHLMAPAKRRIEYEKSRPKLDKEVREHNKKVFDRLREFISSCGEHFFVIRKESTTSDLHAYFPTRFFGEILSPRPEPYLILMTDGGSRVFSTGQSISSIPYCQFSIGNPFAQAIIEVPDKILDNPPYIQDIANLLSEKIRSFPLINEDVKQCITTLERESLISWRNLFHVFSEG